MVDFKKLLIRTRIHDEIKKIVREHNYNATVLGSVGIGKSKILIDLAEELLRKGLIKDVLYGCDSQRLRDSEKDGFPAELEKWGSPELKKITRLECYQTICKWEGRKFDLFLCDEFDTMLTKVYIRAILNNYFKYKLLFSGTLSSEKRKVVKQICPIVYTITTEQAEELGVLNKTNYYIYNYQMSQEESTEYIWYNKKIAFLLQTEGVDNEETQMWIRKRKSFLSNLQTSAKHTKKVISYLKTLQNKRIVVFCNSKEQTERISKWTYYGGNENLDNLTKFQNEEINELAVVAKIQRGINLVKANVGIFEMVMASHVAFDQRNGRLKRLEVNQMATVIFMCPWFKKVINKRTGETGYIPTIIKKYIKSATRNFDNIEFKNLKL